MTHSPPSAPDLPFVDRRTARRAGRASWLVAACLALPLAAQASLIDDLPAGTGYAAWELCSRTLVGGDDFWRVRTDYISPKVQPLPLVWDIDRVLGSKVTVRSWVPFLSNRRIGVFRPGLGCTLITPDTTEAAVRAQPFKPVSTPAASALPWPRGEGTAQTPRLSTARAALLARHSQQMFSEPSHKAGEKLNTLAVLVAQDGELIHEQYAQDYQRQQAQLGWSMTKTVTALIAGLMQRDGRLQLDQPVGLASWQGTPKAAITWRQLLNMAPGMDWNEGYEGASDATQMLFSQGNQGAWAADRQLTSTPGTVFTYSTGFSNVAMLGLKQLAGGSHQALYDFYQARLFAPLAIRGGVIEPDASGTPVGGARGMLRPVDWLRLGQLVANQGQWQGQTLLTPEFMAFLVAASPASSEYGGSIWRQPSPQIPAELRQRLPADLVWFAGHMGQYLIVVPSRNLVVLRMGVAFDKDLSRHQAVALAADLLETP